MLHSVLVCMSVYTLCQVAQCLPVSLFMCTHLNEWMMHLYSALLCIAVHPKRFTIMWGGLSSTTTSVQHPIG